MIKENYLIKKREDWTAQDCIKIDNFIMKGSTTGEFINTLNYLNYHPEGRFEDDSIAVFDNGCGEIRGVLVAAKTGINMVESYPGTTFAGPVIDRTSNLDVIETVMDMILEYYESKYKKIKIKRIPDYYTGQPFHLIDYILLRRGYVYGISALANIVDLRNVKTEEDIWKLFSPRKRNQTRKVMKEQVLVFSEGGVRQNVWANMNQNLKSKYDTKTTHTFDEIQELLKRCPEHMKAYYVDTVDGECAAFALGYLYKNVFHTQYLDMDYRYAGKCPNQMLIFELMRIARRMGYTYFSFGASTENGGEILNRGLYNYKMGYGGGDVVLPVYVKESAE